jgi:hypothetical protein
MEEIEKSLSWDGKLRRHNLIGVKFRSLLLQWPVVFQHSLPHQNILHDIEKKIVTACDLVEKYKLSQKTTAKIFRV